MATVQPSLETVADAQLLARFVEVGDEAAFAELVHRHGPVVRGACRRALGESPDADDAFQCVFLILARKAATLRNAQRLGPWLHTVAVRAAGRASLQIHRRLARERPVTAMPEPAVAATEPIDWLPLLDAEIQRLPDRFRVPLVICELQGKSRSEAALLLGLNEGTLSSRLARARVLLRNRLRHRGALVASAGLTAAFAYGSEAISQSLLTATTQAVLTGAPSASVAALTLGVLKAMLFAKLKSALILVLSLTIASGAFIAGRDFYVRAEDKQASAQSEKSKLEGNWEFVSGKLFGKELEEKDFSEDIKERKFIFKGDKITMKVECAFTIDPGKKPKEIDIKVEEGPENERGTWKGIYELSGDDLVLCFAMPNRDRPSEFDSKAGELIMMMKLKRAK